MNPPIPPQILQRLQTGVDLLQRGRPDEAAAVFRGLVAEQPGLGDGHRLLGLALRDAGEAAGAEASLRAALEIDPTSGPAAVPLCELLLTQGRGEDALAAIAPLATSPGADMHVLTAHGAALKALGRLDEARITYERAAAAAPASAVAEHNLASVLGDLERFAESEAATRRAFAKGLDAPETWLIHARALLGQSRLGEAETAYRAAIARCPDLVDAQGELAQLLWMRTGDAATAAAALDAAIGAFPGLEPLKLRKGELLHAAGDLTGAYDAVAIADGPTAGPMSHIAAARLAVWSEPARALAHASRAVAAAPDNLGALSALCEAHLALGDGAAATAIAEDLRRRAPMDQHAIGLLATAWRLTGDPRYERIYDYDAFVGQSRIDTPDGWPDLETYLADLAVAVGRLHAFHTHPIGQSVRHGSQTSQSLTHSTDPAIRAFFQAVDGPIRRHIRALGDGDDLVRSRRSRDYDFSGIWSVRLRSTGYHTDHLHPKGWLSSACYIALPGAVERGHEGWLKFGEPGVRTTPPMPAERFVKPEPGLLVLFPSYMWHGTVAFSGEEPRLTIAFDVVPTGIG
ncbi:MAG: putative 2OG-Fe(II) oxygenase [Caulobacteraceae bacterium]